MKKLFLLLALMGMVAIGCSKDEVDKGNDNKTEQPNENEGGNEDNIPENIFFGLDKESVTFSPYGGSVDVIVYSNYKWEISGVSDWCTPSVKKGDANEDGQKVTFSADVAYDDREATFWFRCADKQIKFVVSQKLNNDIIYYISSDGKIVTPYDSSAFGATIISNTYIDGVGAIEFNAPITTIGDRAFSTCSSLTSVTIPDSVTTIGNYTFCDCSSLTSVTIPDSVTKIGSCAFKDCSSLQEFKCKFASKDGRCLIVDATLISFAPAGLTEYTIPDSVTTIGGSAFYECSSLISVTIGDSVTSIGGWAFCDCSSLTSVTIPDSVTEIGDNAFQYCRSLTSITIPDSVTTIGYSAFYGCTGELIVNCNIPSASSYSYGAFYGSKFTSVTIGDSVTTIGDYAFSGCTGELIINSKIVETDYEYDNSPSYYGWLSDAEFTKLTIGDSVTSIGNSAFRDCSSLTSVTIGDNVTTIGDEAFEDCSSLTSVTIPDSVTTIGYDAFGECSSLTSVTIGDSVTTIGDFAFYECTSLTSVTIGGSVTTIESYAFDGCSSLTSVTIPDSVTTIGFGAFGECSSLTSVTIPDSVTTIGERAFYECSSLQEFKSKFASEDGRCLIVDGTLNAFAPAGLTEYTIPDSVTTIGDYAFEYCSSLISITIPDSVTTIGNSAFQDCDSLTSITIPDSVTTIGEAAFYECNGLTSVTIPDSVTEIGKRAFYWCDSLESVTIPDSVTTIREDAFYYCSSLTSVYCKAVTPPAALFYSSYWGWGAFDDNASGRKIYVPMESVEAYKSAEGWSKYAPAIVGYNF